MNLKKNSSKVVETTGTDTAKKPHIVFASRGLTAAISAWVGEKKSVTEEFGEILIQLGYNNGEIVILSDFDGPSFSFSCNCDSPEQPKTARISLRYGDFDEFPEVIISTDEYKKSYACQYSMEKKKDHLRLQWQSIKNPDNGNTYYHLLSRCSCQLSVGKEIDGVSYEFSIYASKPDTIVDSGFITPDGDFELKNTEELQKYLLGLSFPISIDEVYKRLCEISLSPVSEFPSLTLKATKKIGDEEPKTTDLVVMVDGDVKEFAMTQNGDTISVGESGEWSCESENYSVSQDEKGNVTYSIISIPETELFKLSPASDRYTVTKIKVTAVKNKVKSLFNK